MFNFFKKNKKPAVINEKKVISDEEIIAIKMQLAQKNELLTLALNNDAEERESIAKLYEEMGLLSVDINIDEAINYLETSLSYKSTIGDGYKCLMSLYNQKRSQSARNGDDAGIEKWMNKMDDMRHIAKKVIISG